MYETLRNAKLIYIDEKSVHRLNSADFIMVLKGKIMSQSLGYWWHTFNLQAHLERGYGFTCIDINLCSFYTTDCSERWAQLELTNLRLPTSLSRYKIQVQLSERRSKANLWRKNRVLLKIQDLKRSCCFVILCCNISPQTALRSSHQHYLKLS